MAARRELRMLAGDEGREGQAEHADRHERAAPAEPLRQRPHGDRCDRPADRAAHGVHGIGPRQPRRRDARGQDRVIRRMKHRIADSAERRERQQHPVALRKTDADHGAAEAGDPDRQDALRAEAIDDEARCHLRDGGDGEEDGHHEAERREIDAETVLHRRKERRQHGLEKWLTQCAAPITPMTRASRLGASRAISVMHGSSIAARHTRNARLGQRIIVASDTYLGC